MHAHVITVDITDPDAATDGLAELIPTLKASPGFVAGYWVRLVEGHGTSLAVFETEEQARATAPARCSAYVSGLATGSARNPGTCL